MLYIDSIGGSDQSLRRWPVGVAVVALLAAALLLSACGGSGDKTTAGGQATAAGSTTAAGDGAAAATAAPGAGPGAARKQDKKERTEADAHRPAPHHGGSPGQKEKAGHHPAAAPGSKHAAPTKPTEGQGPRGTGKPPRHSPQEAASTGIEGASPVVVKKLRKRCPKAMQAAACDDLVEAYVAAQDPSSQPAEPQPQSGRCPETLSRAECEAALAEVTAASESGGSVNVDECLADMTPKCEEALRPAFEAQNQAREEAGE